MTKYSIEFKMKIV